jgi:hypothetical protein
MPAETCSKCLYFILANGRGGKGECHLNPPAVVPTNLGGDSFWPMVKQSDFCSHFTESTEGN